MKTAVSEKVTALKDFFVNNYENPIYEDGIRLKDMVYLEKNLH